MRILHTMLRVTDLERSISFYTAVLGMDILRKNDYPDGKFTLVFLGYADEDKSTVLELTYNWQINYYDIGDAFGHIAIEVDDVYKTCKRINANGGKIVRQAGPMKHGATVLAFVEDPDGYKIELLAKKMR